MTETETKIAPQPFSMEVEKLDFVCAWSLNLQSSDCSLCKSNLLTPVNSDAKNVFKNHISRGRCGHAFHSSCISTYTNSTGSSCPTCLTPWIFDKEIDVGAQWKKKPNKRLQVSYKPADKK